MAFHALRITGALFLVYLGVKSLLSAHRNTGAVLDQPSSASAFRSGLVVNLANPKIGVFAISFLPQFVPTGEAGKGLLVLFALIWVVVDTLWYLVVVSALHRVRGWLVRSRVRRSLEALSGGVLVALGIRLVLTPR